MHSPNESIIEQYIATITQNIQDGQQQELTIKSQLDLLKTQNNSKINDILIELSNLKARKSYVIQYSSLSREQHLLVENYIAVVEHNNKCSNELEVLNKYIIARNKLKQLVAAKNSMIESKVANLICHIEQMQKTRFLSSELNIATFVLNETLRLINSKYISNYNYVDRYGYSGTEKLRTFCFMIFALFAVYSVFFGLIGCSIPHVIVPLAVIALISLVISSVLSIVFSSRFEFTNRMIQVYGSLEYTLQLDGVLQQYSKENNPELYNKLNDLLEKIEISSNIRDKRSRVKSPSDILINDIEKILSANTEIAIDTVIAKYANSNKSNRFYSEQNIAEKMKMLKLEIMKSEPFLSNQARALSQYS